MKKLILSASCVNEYFDEAPNYVVVEIDDDFLSLLQEAQKVVASNRAFVNLDIWSHKPVWFNSFEHENNEELIEIANKLNDDLTPVRMQTSYFSVSEDYIQIDSVPKHTGDDCKVLSDIVSFENLLSKDLIISDS